MKLGVLAIAAVACATVGASATANAQTYGGGYPVCLQSYAPIQFIDCRYASIPQCQASASGRAAMCIVNPYFDASGPGSRRLRAKG